MTIQRAILDVAGAVDAFAALTSLFVVDAESASTAVSAPRLHHAVGAEPAAAAFFACRLLLVVDTESVAVATSAILLEPAVGADLASTTGSASTLPLVMDANCDRHNSCKGVCALSAVCAAALGERYRSLLFNPYSLPP